MNIPGTIRQKFDNGFKSRVIELLDKKYGVVSRDRVKRMFAKEIARLANESIVSDMCPYF